VRCGTQVEKIRKFSDPPLTKCGKCGGKLEQLLSSPAFRFKGTGWYVTDYPHPSSAGNAEKAEKGNKEGAVSDKSEKASAEKAPKQSGTEASGTKEAAPAPKPGASKDRPHK
jgi:putative FmdB family regulatory protein